MATNQREKAIRNEQMADKRPYAIARYIRISPYKLHIVLDLVRGKKYDDAVAILSHTNKSGCLPILKLINSAAANAENNMNMPKDSLYIVECFAMPGPTLKRMMPRAKGRGDRILKRTSHIKVILDEKVDPNALIKPKVKVKKEVTKEPAKKATGGSEVKKAAPKATTTKTTLKPKVSIDSTAEKPLAKEPNAKKPLGTKKEVKSEGAK